MKSFLKSPAILALAIALSAAAPASAVVLTSSTDGTGIASGFFGQSFTITGSGSFTNIVFNFFSDSPATTPAASVTGYFLSTAYAGTPGALGGATPGFLGSAAAASGFYSFGSGVTLLAGTQYFLYSNGSFGGGITGNSSGTYSGGDAYQAITAASSFIILTGQDTNFRVTGNAVGAVDGGSTAVMLALGAMGLLLGRRSLRPRAS